MPAVVAVRYWGVTGSFANPLLPEQVRQKVLASLDWLSRDAEFQRGLATHAGDEAWMAEQLDRIVPFAWRSTYGGNTTCIEVRTPTALLVLDAGTGLRRLGEQLNRRWDAEDYQGDRTAHVLLTHAHMDHTFATPFVDPYYDARNRFHIWAPDKVLRSLHAVLSPASVLRSTYFPPTYESLEGIKQFHTVQPGSTFEINDCRIATYPLCHPGDCLAYRIEAADHTFVFASDHEHPQSPDEGLAAFARDADLLYVDAQFRSDEYQGQTSIGDERPMSRVGWGHSTVEDVIATAVAAGVKRLHLGHHDPKRTDVQLAELELYARQLTHDALRRHAMSPDSLEICLAREGLEVQLP